ncbi:hypothetical protein CSUI_002653 [Cystoisospora suis]|uniref:Transmembrane protein n=1 Tax=Cystoisospora suis TaxID=483139 RepID=A0A2C6L7X9_9APIC|nr:hypothetical protein CSUI_002653 [Cystoisospora suis]
MSWKRANDQTLPLSLSSSFSFICPSLPPTILFFLSSFRFLSLSDLPGCCCWSSSRSRSRRRPLSPRLSFAPCFFFLRSLFI